MIVLDTSALVAILLDEPGANGLLDAIETADAVAISAGTLAECFVVAKGKNIASEMRALLTAIAPVVLDVDEVAAERIGDGYAVWGKGFHPARLNFGDMFAYDATTSLGAPLLFVGEDFAGTDVAPALAQNGETP
ncbi:type II toxin-antitoxin system VapC family toxin [Rubrimonas sp.]|uniref:type II toxin-antitoxin system VapC family toxin n=1 Tax=Rubrimonas sp. TaxID=2036015 RepID=UPI002FDDA0D5